jgi:hypothetical protein
MGAKITKCRKAGIALGFGKVVLGLLNSVFMCFTFFFTEK